MYLQNFTKFFSKSCLCLVLAMLFGCNSFEEDADKSLQITPLQRFNNPRQTYHQQIYQQPYYQQPYYYRPNYQYPNSQFYSNPYAIHQPSQYPYYDYDQYYIPPTYYNTEPTYMAPSQNGVLNKS